MKRVTHLFVGTSIGLILCTQPSLCLYSVAPSLMGSYVPDFDLRKSHRKLLHNIFSMVIIAGMIWFFLDYFKTSLPVSKTLVVGAFLLGYMSHLFLDLLTLRGVSLLYPFSSRAFSGGLCRSNSVIANLVFIVISLIIISLRVYEMVCEKILQSVLNVLF